MNVLNKILDREIIFIEYNTSINWTVDLPNSNWCLIIIGDEKNTNYFSEIIRKSIDRNVCYICGVGKQHKLIHKMADEELEFREVDVENHYLPKYPILTVGDEDFEDGLWYGIFATHNEETEINQIVILDTTNLNLNYIDELLEMFRNGYLPTDK